ncbi:helix-turn-helix transcriptional regulator [Adlercreutzia sp. R7]|uniref:Helix-turn-helix transcriptional regulator n=1 Tax=Adlercreutzia wanghongyangiae TaxID=3111451 RepID=A0ABU6IJX8_9ACTN|nr:helix-turn-helix transcriptional regulator [Adlercreutzia sp. R7]
MMQSATSDAARLAVAAGSYGLFLACTSIVLWGGYTVLLPGSAASYDARAVEYFVRCGAFPLSLFAAAAVAYRRPKSAVWRHPLVALSLFLMVPAIVGAHMAGLIGLHGALVLCAACLGCGSGFMFCFLQEMVASLKVYDAGIVVFAAAGISAAVCIAIGQLPRATMMWLGFLVLVPAMAAAVLGARRFVGQVHPAFDTIPAQQVDRCRRAARESWPSLICIAFSAFVVGLIRVEAINNAEVSQAFDNANMVGLLITSVVLLATWKTVYERVGLARLYQIVFPLTATIYLLLPLLDSTFHQWLVLLVFAVFSVTSSLMVVSCSRVARNQCVQPVLVYGVFAGTVYAAMELGLLLGCILDNTAGIGFAGLSVVALVAIYCMSMMMNAKRQQGVTAPAPSPEDAPAEDASQPAAPSASPCDQVVVQYGLSAREADVLGLLARGRDAAYIAEELVISKNTVRTHMKNIFAKTGVHSRQELIDLLETVER